MRLFVVTRGSYVMYIIAGLGNPERRYDNTRHNIGYEVIDAISDEYRIDLNMDKHRAICGRGIVEGEKVLLMKPLTYMNLSGQAIVSALSYYKEDPSDSLLVLCDDVNLPCGMIRIRERGSAGGHNGLKNIIALTGSEDFKRIRVGVGEKPPRYDLADWVLGHYSPQDRTLMDEAIGDAVKAAALTVTGDIAKAMNLYNKKKDSSSLRSSE